MKDVGSEAKAYVQPLYTFCHDGLLKSHRSAEARNGASKDAEMVDKHDQHQPEPEPEPEPIDYDAEVERRRKRREAIKAKYMGSSTPLRVQVLQPGIESGPSTPQAESPSAQHERSGAYFPSCFRLTGR